jgi:hypothetical protein
MIFSTSLKNLSLLLSFLSRLFKSIIITKKILNLKMKMIKNTILINQIFPLPKLLENKALIILEIMFTNLQ